MFALVMSRFLRKTLKIIGYTLGGLVAVLLLYVAAAFGLALIPVAAEPVPPGGPRIPVYLYTPNGIHTDLVLPVRTTQADWSQQIKYAHTTAAIARATITWLLAGAIRASFIFQVGAT